MNQAKKIGEKRYINKNCWLVRSLNYPPYKRCQYCELKFRDCQFLHYQIISLILIVLFLSLFFLIKEKSLELLILSLFTCIIIYGYFFNKTTDKIIEENFVRKKLEIETLREKIRREEAEKLAERERKLRLEIERLSDAKDQFIVSISHHLRTPLASIRGYLDILLGGVFGEIKNKEIKKRLENMKILDFNFRFYLK